MLQWYKTVADTMNQHRPLFYLFEQLLWNLQLWSSVSGIRTETVSVATRLPPRLNTMIELERNRKVKDFTLFCSRCCIDSDLLSGLCGVLLSLFCVASIVSTS